LLPQFHNLKVILSFIDFELRLYLMPKIAFAADIYAYHYITSVFLPTRHLPARFVCVTVTDMLMTMLSPGPH